MGNFPTTAADVTPAWLETQLRAAGVLGRARITDLSWVSIGTGQVGDMARLTIAYDGPDAGPATIAAKFASSDASSRGSAGLLGLYTREVRFYRELAAKIGTRTPRCYGSELSANGDQFVLLLEDLAPARAGNQLDGCTVEEARHGIVQLAALHGATFCASWLDSIEWLKPAEGFVDQMVAMYPQAHAIFLDRYAGQLAPAWVEVMEALNTHIEAFSSRMPEQRSVCHMDFRLDNLLFDIRDGSEPVAVVDWQTVGADCPLKDLGYFLGCGVGSALRRRHEDELLDLYCEEMGRAGVRLSRSEIWSRYRLGAFHGVATAVFSAAFVARTERGDANFLSMARNACELAIDHDSIAVLRTLAETGAC